jgi:hypothetical protein
MYTPENCFQLPMYSEQHINTICQIYVPSNDFSYNYFDVKYDIRKSNVCLTLKHHFFVVVAHITKYRLKLDLIKTIVVSVIVFINDRARKRLNPGLTLVYVLLSPYSNENKFHFI